MTFLKNIISIHKEIEDHSIEEGLDINLRNVWYLNYTYNMKCICTWMHVMHESFKTFVFSVLLILFFFFFRVEGIKTLICLNVWIYYAKLPYKSYIFSFLFFCLFIILIIFKLQKLSFWTIWNQTKGPIWNWAWAKQIGLGSQTKLGLGQTKLAWGPY